MSFWRRSCGRGRVRRVRQLLGRILHRSRGRRLRRILSGRWSLARMGSISLLGGRIGSLGYGQSLTARRDVERMRGLKAIRMRMMKTPDILVRQFSTRSPFASIMATRRPFLT